jgi:hypothetical protein
VSFKISGRIRERESGYGVRGLTVQPVDDHTLYDDVLGIAVTDKEGRFEIDYEIRRVPVLFDRKPALRLFVYAPPRRLLMATKEAIAWGASEHVELTVERDSLRSTSPELPEDIVEGGLALERDSAGLRKLDGFDVPHLPAFALGGPVGAPSLPEQIQSVLLPLGGDILGIDVEPGDAVRLGSDVKPLPVQEPVFDEPESKRFAGLRRRFRPLDPKYAQGRAPYPKAMVELGRVEPFGRIQLVLIRIRPVQYDPRKGAFLFHPNLRYHLRFDADAAAARPRRRGDRDEGIGLVEIGMVNKLVEQPGVFSAKDLYMAKKWITEKVPYVIITDNYQWPEQVELGDGTSTPPALANRGAHIGDVVEEFERLAEWKTSRGMTTRVVTVSEIIGSGEYTDGGRARDLQEVIRNYLDHRRRFLAWGTRFALLAGNKDIVPMRELLGSYMHWRGDWSCELGETNPPEPGHGFFVEESLLVKLRLNFSPSGTEPIYTHRGGQQIDYNRSAGPGSMGWYYTTQEGFENNSGFTRLPEGKTSQYVIVEGPRQVIHDNYIWKLIDNSIPSDLYYSHYPETSSGRPAFDANNNGVYGQYYRVGETTVDFLDGHGLTSQVYVGRASIASAADAKAFVDKVLTYERLAKPDGTKVEWDYLRKVIYASDFYAHVWHKPEDSDTPSEGKFSYRPSLRETRLHSDVEVTVTAGTPSHRLVARRDPKMVVIRYRPGASVGELGWFFTTDDTYSTESEIPTMYVKIVGPEPEINPSRIVWDDIGLDKSSREKELLRDQMDGWFPNFHNVERHYTDCLEPELGDEPMLEQLYPSTVRAAIDGGVHFLSMSGHGSARGCCFVYRDHDFDNLDEYFIGYANACNTARPPDSLTTPDSHSLATDVVVHEGGGAVAFVGSSRRLPIDPAPPYEQSFWKMLAQYGRLGPAMGMRITDVASENVLLMYELNLFGDPEMPVWTDLPKELDVWHPESADRGEMITVRVRDRGSPYVAKVTLMAGWRGSAQWPLLLMSKDSVTGEASFTLPTAGDYEELSVTVTDEDQNVLPYVGRIAINS